MAMAAIIALRTYQPNSALINLLLQFAERAGTSPAKICSKILEPAYYIIDLHLLD